jgi:alpha-L-fucosidase
MPYIGEWLMSAFRIPNREYGRLADEFNPQRFDADEWVRLAKAAGMRYIVYTAKHHDGFAMYHSKVDPYNIYDATPFKRDPLAELTEACRKHGLALGLYYSQDLDWHEPDGGDPGPDFPLNAGMWSWGNNWDFPDWKSKNYQRYFEKKVKPQVNELLTNYGPICLIWFDCPLTISEAQSRDLVGLVKACQPDCLVNSRVGNGLGDYGSMGDNEVPSNRVPGIWETAATMNDTWGYKYFDQNWKAPHDLLSILVGLASKNVNYLLNVGPQPDGALPEGAVNTLKALAGWAGVHGEAIHGTGENPFPYDFEWGWISAGEKRLYLFLKDSSRQHLELFGLQSRVERAYPLANPEAALAFRQDGDWLALELPGKSEFPLPVMALELAGPVAVDSRLIAQEGGVLTLPAVQACVHGNEDQNGSTPAILQTGILGGWEDTHAWLEWEVQMPSPGEYAVELVSSMLNHSMAWQGGHRVRVEVDGAALEGVLALDEPVTRPEARYYPQAVSRLGSVRVEHGGAGRVVLRALEIRNNGGVGLALVRVVLKKIS